MFTIHNDWWGGGWGGGAAAQFQVKAVVLCWWQVLHGSINWVDDVNWPL